MYWKSILLFATWPVLILISLYLVQYAVKKYNDKLEHVKKKYEE